MQISEHGVIFSAFSKAMFFGTRQRTAAEPLAEQSISHVACCPLRDLPTLRTEDWRARREDDTPLQMEPRLCGGRMALSSDSPCRAVHLHYSGGSKTFPGFMMPNSSRLFLIFCMTPMVSNPSSLTNDCFLPIPIPCSPVHVPSISKALSTIR